MRRPVLAVLGLVGLSACTGPPGSIEAEPAESVAVNAPKIGEGGPDGGGSSADGEDDLLARVRASMRDGRVPERARADLEASNDPEHRRAARLLATIDGRLPVAELPESGPKPEPEPDLELPPEVVVRGGADLTVVSEWPAADRYPSGTVAHAWFAGRVEVEDRVRPRAGGGPLGAWLAVLQPPPLLLDRPPRPEHLGARSLAPHRDPSLVRGLVILTSVKLEFEPAEKSATLVFSGAGSVDVEHRSDADQRVLLWIDGAGAMPSFSMARPSCAALSVVDVRREQDRVEVEVELAQGWSVSSSSSKPNGARVVFGGPG